MISFAWAIAASDRMAATVSAAATAISRASLRIGVTWRPILARIWGAQRGGASRLLALLCLLAAASPTQASQPVAIVLVLALDSSASVDRNEFALEVEGFAAAFRDP